MLLDAATVASNFGAAYFSYKAANRPVYTGECAWAQVISPNEEAIEVMDRATLEAIAVHNELVKECE